MARLTREAPFGRLARMDRIGDNRAMSSSSSTSKAKTPTWTSAVHEVFSYRGTGLACLVVQSNEDRDHHVSEVDACDDYTTEDPAALWSSKVRAYSMCPASDDVVYLAHSGKVLCRGPLDSLEPILTHDKDVTRLCGARRGVYLVGLGGYVGHFDGETLHDLPVPDSDVYSVAESRNGTLWAAGSKGRVYRRVGDVWEAIRVGGEGDVRFVAAKDDAILFAGASGLCGRIDGDTVTRFDTPVAREYFAVAVFRGRVYVGAGRDGLDVVESERVVPFKENVYSYHLSADDEHLFAGGLSEAARFDGEGWLATAFASQV